MGCCCCRLSVYDEDEAHYGNFSSADFTPTSGAPEITFELRFGSHGTINMFIGADADAAGEELRADVRIRTNDSTGTLVRAPNIVDGGIAWFFDPAKPAFENFYGERPLEPLELSPGTYWAQLEVFTDSTTIDIRHQWLRFGP